MNDIIKKSLSDILMSIDGIHVHLQDKTDFHWYQKSITVKRAVERELSIIGEAVNHTLKEDTNFPLSSARKLFPSATGLFILMIQLMIIWSGKSSLKIYLYFTQRF